MIFDLSKRDFSMENHILPQNDQLILLLKEELDHLQALYPFSESNYRDCRKIRSTKIDIYDQYYFGTLHIPLMEPEKDASLSLGFFLTRHSFILVCENQQDQEHFRLLLHKRQALASDLSKCLLYFFEDLLEENAGYLEKAEDSIIHMEEEVLSGRLSGFNKRMTPLRKHLLYLHNYYEQLGDLCDLLQENQLGFIGRDALLLFHHLSRHCDRLSGSTQVLQAYSMQVREIYQAQVDLQQNKIMKSLTIVTTIFLPLTLIAGWYGMNFAHMPELSWKYGYPLVIILSVLIVVLCVLLMKKKRFWN